MSKAKNQTQIARLVLLAVAAIGLSYALPIPVLQTANAQECEFKEDKVECPEGIELKEDKAEFPGLGIELKEDKIELPGCEVKEDKVECPEVEESG